MPLWEIMICGMLLWKHSPMAKYLTSKTKGKFKDKTTPSKKCFLIMSDLISMLELSTPWKGTEPLPHASTKQPMAWSDALTFSEVLKSQNKKCRVSLILNKISAMMNRRTDKGSVKLPNQQD